MLTATKISLIIPTFNEEERIGKLMELLNRNSRGLLYEIIVADGGSTDQTQRIAKHFGAEVIDCKCRRRSCQMNRGAEKAGGDILYFLHADSSPPTGFDEAIIRSVQQGVEAGCFRLKFNNLHPLLCFYGWCTRFDVDLFRFGDQSLFITRNVFMEIGGYSEHLMVMEDQEIIRRIRHHSDFKIIEQSVVTSARKYRQNGVCRLQFIFCMIVLLYYSGAKQETLVHFYHSCIN